MEGSVWNPNSWHWETKNYLPIAKKIIEENVMLFELKDE